MLITPALAAPADGLTATSTRGRIPDVTVLFTQAVNVVHRTRPPTFKRAVMLEADGSTQGQRGVTSAAGIVAWRFALQNPSGRFPAVMVSYGPAPRRFGRVVGLTQPVLEDVVIRRAPGMTLADAIRRLRRAGYRKPFFNVVLRNPLGPQRLNPLYIFGLAHRFVAVDTVTGKVRPIH
jgi:hypothetical protein